MPDRQAGPVIRRARSACSLTSKHHYVASVTPPAFPTPFSPPPSTKKSRGPRSARSRADCVAQVNTALRTTTDPQRARRRTAGA
ncbi:hypothetical protein K523DRAFT_398332 [Schizophyllum commune Tattone D]|nr:hypothetical protein K523DRAFT_398332 [Schizophyllum commune Tattone D]